MTEEVQENQDEGLDTGAAAAGAEAPELEDDAEVADPSIIGKPGVGVIEYDIEYKHPKSSGVVTVYAADPETAKAALKIDIEARFGAGADLQVLACAAAE